ncbi:hypothetical protein CTI12_AA202890 [Artemisia annua]|uniref:Uncharacterized protein n=1 Tax=Artemisia annua TaxID=35608 RepID=A0A2U1LWQ0_ARTAN|nr:hypothetical protein CTI12_AA444590 [Artemisia annua]PWA79935.1 hypothetical protein CTI12_AA202890 [Artemisia annua]
MAMKNLCFAFVIIGLLATTHFSAVQCRSTPTTDNTGISTIADTECNQSGREIAEFSVLSTNNASDVDHRESRRLKMRSIAYKLASGPSKRGPGH